MKFISNNKTMGTPNWGRLFQEWRCKAIGVAWTDLELEALKNWVSPKDIQSGEWKSDEEVNTNIPWDEKEVKKQLRQTLREKGVGFSNADTLEKLQERLSKAM